MQRSIARPVSVRMEALFGATLLFNGKNVPVSDVAAPFVAVYFAAGWHGPCQRFTP